MVNKISTRTSSWCGEGWRQRLMACGLASVTLLVLVLASSGEVATAATAPHGAPMPPTLSLTVHPASRMMTVAWAGGSGSGLPATAILTMKGNVTSTNCPKTWTLAAGHTLAGSCQITGPWGTVYSVSIKLVQGSTGRTVGVTATATLPKPPPPSVTVSRGAPHTIPALCTSSACAYVHVQTANFSAAVTCRFNSWSGNGGWHNYTYGPNDSHDSGNVYGWPGTWVTVACTTALGQSAAGTDTSW